MSLVSFVSPVVLLSVGDLWTSTFCYLKNVFFCFSSLLFISFPLPALILCSSSWKEDTSVYVTVYCEYHCVHVLCVVFQISGQQKKQKWWNFGMKGCPGLSKSVFYDTFSNMENVSFLNISLFVFFSVLWSDLMYLSCNWKKNFEHKKQKCRCTLRSQWKSLAFEKLFIWLIYLFFK